MDTPQAAVLAYFDAVNKGDADAAADTFATDGAMMAHQVQTLVGREVIRNALRGMFQDMKVVAMPAMGDVKEDGEWAFAETTSAGSLQIQSAGVTQPADHRELFVLRRGDGGWRIAYYMFNDHTGLPA